MSIYSFSNPGWPGSDLSDGFCTYISSKFLTPHDLSALSISIALTGLAIPVVAIIVHPPLLCLANVPSLPAATPSLHIAMTYVHDAIV